MCSDLWVNPRSLIFHGCRNYSKFAVLMRTRTNLKKAFPKDSLENDCTSKASRKVVAYVSNVRGIKRFVKKRLSKRLRITSKRLAREEEE